MSELFEEYRAGYPRYSALVAANNDFFVCRRFLRARVRLLLVKQDKICLMEQQLDELDRNESRRLFLGKIRRDTNITRASLLSEMNMHLQSYEEIKYLDYKRELVSLASPGDCAIKRLEDWVEDHFVGHFKGFRSLPEHNLSSDPHVFLYSGLLIKRTAKAVMLVRITLLLLMPVIICIVIDSVWARICVIIISTMLYLSTLSQLTNSRMMELILAGAT
ncbi:hypothetical protein GQ53DRAFT_781381 [Thozetella sp. PMI_491]|nr:hypothetical protein GQ53DRAFT_781381 [Thozetella sp. PMI_491]